MSSDSVWIKSGRIETDAISMGHSISSRSFICESLRRYSNSSVDFFVGQNCLEKKTIRHYKIQKAHLFSCKIVNRML